MISKHLSLLLSSSPIVFPSLMFVRVHTKDSVQIVKMASGRTLCVSLLLMLSCTTNFEERSAMATPEEGCVSNNTVTNVTTNSVQTLSNDARKKTRWHYLHEIKSCTWDHVVVFTEKGKYNDLEKQFLSFLRDESLKFTLYSITEEDFRDSVHKEYVDFGHLNYVIISDRSHALLKEINSLLSNFSRSDMAAFPHRSSWLLIHGSGAPRLARIKHGCVLDNVALVSMRREIITDIRTLLWRQNRRREWDLLDPNRFGRQCSIYPNKRNGMNGRILKMSVRNITYAINVYNDSLGNVRYVGFFMDVARELQERMNFTVDFVHVTDSWAHYDLMVHEREVDVGLAYFSETSAKQGGMNAVYPIIFDDVGAAYVYDDRALLRQSLNNISPPASHVALTLVCTLFGVVVVHQIITCMHEWITQGERRCSFDYMNTKTKRISGNKHLKLIMNRCKRQNLLKTSPNLEKTDIPHQFRIADDRKTCDERITTRWRMTSFLVNILNVCRDIQRNMPDFHFIDFYGAYLNQTTFVHPKSMALRVFIFSWCIFSLLITWLLVGLMTANLVKPLNSAPIDSLPEALQSDLTECGTFETTEIHDKAMHWTLGTGKSWGGSLVHFPVRLDTRPEEFRSFMKKPSSKMKVFIYYKHILNYYKAHGFSDLYIVKNDFQQANLGFVVPPNSELRFVLAEPIMRLHEMGLIKKFYKPYVTSSDTQHAAISKASNPHGAAPSIDLGYYENFVYLILILLGVALTVLGLELVGRRVGGHFQADTSVSDDP